MGASRSSVMEQYVFRVKPRAVLLLVACVLLLLGAFAFLWLRYNSTSIHPSPLPVGSLSLSAGPVDSVAIADDDLVLVDHTIFEYDPATGLTPKTVLSSDCYFHRTAITYGRDMYDDSVLELDDAFVMVRLDTRSEDGTMCGWELVVVSPDGTEVKTLLDISADSVSLRMVDAVDLDGDGYLEIVAIVSFTGDNGHKDDLYVFKRDASQESGYSLIWRLGDHMSGSPSQAMVTMLPSPAIGVLLIDGEPYSPEHYRLAEISSDGDGGYAHKDFTFTPFDRAVNLVGHAHSNGESRWIFAEGIPAGTKVSCSGEETVSSFALPSTSLRGVVDIIGDSNPELCCLARKNQRASSLEIISLEGSVVETIGGVSPSYIKAIDADGNGTQDIVCVEMFNEGDYKAPFSRVFLVRKDLSGVWKDPELLIEPGKLVTSFDVGELGGVPCALIGTDADSGDSLFVLPLNAK